MKLIYTVLLVGAVVAVALGGEYHKPCGKPACKQCYVPTHKPPCTEHVTKPVTCGVPTCVRCYHPTPKPPCKEHVPKPCGVPTCVKCYKPTPKPPCKPHYTTPCHTHPKPCIHCGHHSCNCIRRFYH